jgi:hypothetical protein
MCTRNPCLEYNSVEMIGQPQYASASELRYILDVMEECSHLGLDNETACKLRKILAQRIADAENGIHGYSASSMALVTEDSKIHA